jgi:hypothetical protein
MSDVERELGLDRDLLVRLALLLGSDYTEGCQGVGIVNAVEVRGAGAGAWGWGWGCQAGIKGQGVGAGQRWGRGWGRQQEPSASRTSEQAPYLRRNARIQPCPHKHRPTTHPPPPARPPTRQVLHAFPGLEGLGRFKSWVDGVDTAALAEAAAQQQAAAARGRQGGRAGAPGQDGDAEQQTQQGAAAPEAAAAAAGQSAGEQAFMRAHRGVRRSWQVRSRQQGAGGQGEHRRWMGEHLP